MSVSVMFAAPTIEDESDQTLPSSTDEWKVLQRFENNYFMYICVYDQL